MSSHLINLRIEEGAAGYGVYWMVIELLRDQPEYKYNSNHKAIAFAINENDIELVQRVVNNFSLFDHDDNGLLFSPWLCSQMEEYDAKKKKLSEAGKRGAAKKAAMQEQTTQQNQATLKPPSSHPQAYNITQHNISQQNITASVEASEVEWKRICIEQGMKVTMEHMDYLARNSKEGHAPAYIAQVCMQWNIGENVLRYLCKKTDNANTKNKAYLALVKAIKSMEAGKVKPQYPANFLCSKLAEI